MKYTYKLGGEFELEPTSLHVMVVCIVQTFGKITLCVSGAHFLKIYFTITFQILTIVEVDSTNFRIYFHGCKSCSFPIHS